MAVNGAFTGRYYLGLNRHKLIAVLLLVSLLLAPAVQAETADKEPAKLNINKAMVVNFFKSLVIPGWGQWSNGHKGRAIAYATAELAGIYGYHAKQAAAIDKVVEFKAFADEHWDYQTWSLSDDGATACGAYLRTHRMPTYIDDNNIVQPYKDHHFYENISKYPEFVCGWDDIAQQWKEAERVYTPNKYEYIQMRTLSNDLYKDAQVIGTLIMVNHLVSAFDAAFGTDISKFETTNYTGKFYINPLNAVSRIGLEVKF